MLAVAGEIALRQLIAFKALVAGAIVALENREGTAMQSMYRC